MIGLASQAITMRAMAEYQLYQGDVLEINSPGVPEISRRTAVGDNGKISLPLIGEVTAIGLSLPQLRLKVQELMAGKNMRHSDVTIMIVGHRPVYINGDVASPGPYPFRPGMMVRDVVALADDADGGLLRNTRGDGARFAADLVDQSLRAARLQAALTGQKEMDQKHIVTGPIAPTLLSEMIAAQNQQLKVEQDNYDKEKIHLQQMIKQTIEQISALDRAQHGVAQEVDQLQKDGARTRELLQKGLVQVSRVEDQQRAIAGATARLFDVMARASAARKELEMLNWQIQEAGDKRKIANLEKLEQALGQLAATRALLASGGEASIAKTGGGPRLSQSGGQGRRFVISRKSGEQQQQIAATETSYVLPGDIVEVNGVTSVWPQGSRE